MEYKEVRKLVDYWIITAQHDYETMLSLFRIKRYSDCLFYGHIVIEKILKAHVVSETKQHAPYIHDLVRLQEVAQLNLSEHELDFLDAMNDYNIRARYPEIKLEFYKRCTREYTKNKLDSIKKLYKNLCQELEQKKL